MTTNSRREFTQFSRLEYQQFKDTDVKAESPTEKQRAMFIFSDYAENFGELTPGGFTNIKTIRAFKNDEGDLYFETTPLLTPDQLKAKERREADEKRRQAEAERVAKLTSTDIAAAKAAFDRKIKEARVRAKEAREAYLKSPKGKQEAYSLALKQREYELKQQKRK